MFQSGNLKKDKENYEKQMSHELYNLEQDISQQRVNSIGKNCESINTLFYFDIVNIF